MGWRLVMLGRIIAALSALVVGMALSGELKGACSAPLRDFCVTDNVARLVGPDFDGLPCKKRALVTSADFKSRLVAAPLPIILPPFNVGAVMVTALELPGLNTLGLSLGRVDLGPQGVVPPHFHPRATEIIYVLRGTVACGFVDTLNVHYNVTLGQGEVFVVPLATLHYIYNPGPNAAYTISFYNHQNPGVALIPLTTFTIKPTSILDYILQTSFFASQEQVRFMKSKLGPLGITPIVTTF